MSTSAVRRIKDRGGAGGRVTAGKPLTPHSDSKASSLPGSKLYNGKENSIVRGVSHKPSIRPMPRIDRHSDASGAGTGDSRKRWSISSSVPRGRSLSPSDSVQMLSDLRRDKESRVKAEEQSVKEFGSSGRGRNGVKVLERKRSGASNSKVGEKGMNGLGGLRCYKANGHVEGKLEKSSGRELELNFVNGGEKLVSKAKFFDGCNDPESHLLSNSTGLRNGSNCPLSSSKAGSRKVVGKDAVSTATVGVGNNEDATLGKMDGEELDSKKMNVEKVRNVGRCEVVLLEKTASERLGNKFPSRLHEKLAFLEGKVKRIASDIKRTKEMLDLNNPDTSKVMISDIQEKISGIEKMMSHVKGSSLRNLCSSGTNTGNQEKAEESNRISLGKCDGNGPLKEMKNAELEAQPFSHHKLPIDQSSVKGSSSSDSNQSVPHVPKSNTKQSSVQVLLGTTDENPIAMEFLASQSKEQSKVIVGDADAGLEGNEVHETEEAANSAVRESSNSIVEKHITDLDLRADERLEEFEDRENKSAMIVEEEIIDDSIYQLRSLGSKASTGGWFVAEGESVLLAHDDGSCSFYDIANHEVKAEYKPPSGISSNVWRDCWIIRAASADGCAGKYVVAASAGNTIDSGFCSWDFYTKKVRAFHVEGKSANTREVLGPLSDNAMHRRNALSRLMCSQNQQWWYRPCGPLMISTASCQRTVKVFDVRDGERIMKWEVQKPVLVMDYSSPLQWRNRGKVVIAEAEAISLWDVSSLNAQALSSVSDSGRKVSAMDINNTDGQMGGGVRQRVSSSEAGHDGVFCTPNSLNVIDFREPSGVGLKIPLLGINSQSVYSRGDSIYVGCSSTKSVGKKQACSKVVQFALRRQKPVQSYVVPGWDAHPHHTAITQVWGNSNLVIGVCGLGLFVFDATNPEALPCFAMDYVSEQKAREVIGPDDLYAPTFDYTSSQILVISRDRPAMFRVMQ